MHDARQQRLEDLFHQALDLDRGARSDFVAAHCDADAELGAELRALLAHADEDTKAYLEPQLLAATAPAAATEVPRPVRVGRYRITDTIGAGGMGIVYEALQEKPHRKVALKVVRPRLFTPSLLRRFEHEAEALGRLHHPGIAHVYEAGSSDLGHGIQPFIAMELVHGLPLHRFASERELSTREKVELIARVGDAVHHAHQQGVIHRDLKPDNILVSDDGEPKVLDFGVAAVEGAADRGLLGEGAGEAGETRHGQVLGTLAYMSPEQARGERGDISTASDLYSLGVITYQVLAGQLPHDVAGMSTAEAATTKVEREPPTLGALSPRLRGDLELVVAKTLAPDRDDRYDSVAAFVADLRRWLDDEPILAREPTPLYQLRKFARRNRALVAGALATTLAVAAGTTVAIVLALATRDQRNAARALAYRLGVRSAIETADRGDHLAARRLLEDTPAEHRGWEWHHARARTSQWRQEIAVASGLRGPICYTPDGTRLVGAMRDGSIGVWEIATGKLSRPFPAGAAITAIARQIPDAPPRLAAGAADGRIFVWNLATKAPPDVLTGHGRPVLHLAWSGTGELFSLDKREWRAWRGTACTRSGPATDARRPPGAMAVAPDGSCVVALSYYRVIRWDTATGAGTLVVDPAHSDDVLFGPRGRLVLSTRHQNVRLRDPHSLSRLDDDRGHVRAIDKLALSPNGQLLASTSHDGTLTLRDAKSLALLGVHGAGKPLSQLAFRADGRQLACADEDGQRLTLWDLPLGPALVLPHGTSNVDALLWSPDSELLVTGTKTRALRVFDGETGTLLLRRRGRPLACSADSSRILFTDRGAVTTLDLATGETTEVSTLPVTTALHDFLARYGGIAATGSEIDDVSHDGRMEARVARRSVRVVALPSGEALAVPAVRHRAWCARFAGDGRHLAVGSPAGAVTLLETTTWSRAGVLQPRTKTRVLDIDFSPDGSRIAVACRDNRVRLYARESREFIVELEGHTSHVAAVLFSPDGSRLATASGDDTARIWDTRSRSERRNAARERDERRARIAGRVDRLMRALGNGRQVAAALRTDSRLDLRERSDGLRVLMLRR